MSFDAHHTGVCGWDGVRFLWVPGFVCVRVCACVCVWHSAAKGALRSLCYGLLTLLPGAPALSSAKYEEELTELEARLANQYKSNDLKRTNKGGRHGVRAHPPMLGTLRCAAAPKCPLGSAGKLVVSACTCDLTPNAPMPILFTRNTRSEAVLCGITPAYITARRRAQGAAQPVAGSISDRRESALTERCPHVLCARVYRASARAVTTNPTARIRCQT